MSWQFGSCFSWVAKKVNVTGRLSSLFFIGCGAGSLATPPLAGFIFTSRLLMFTVIFYTKEGKQGTECSGKNVFFQNSLQPLPLLHRCKRPAKLSTQCKCTVTPIGGQFFVQPIAGEGEVVIFRKFLEKKTQYSMNILYLFRKCNASRRASRQFSVRHTCSSRKWKIRKLVRNKFQHIRTLVINTLVN